MNDRWPDEKLVEAQRMLCDRSIDEVAAALGVDVFELRLQLTPPAGRPEHANVGFEDLKSSSRGFMW